ncbi:hypothetical protein ACFL1H_06380 [Nanoarchaeota archaeon]
MELNTKKMVEDIIAYSESQNYDIHSKFGDNPRLFIYGYTHPNQKMVQEDELFNILSKFAQSGDMLAMEGKGPSEVAYDGYFRDDLIGKLKQIFINKGVRTIHNDNKEIIVQFMLLSNKYKIAKEKNDPNLEKIKSEYDQIQIKRDDNFCLHESTGIVHLINGTANIWKPLENDLYQLLGAGHLMDGQIYNQLKNNNISYISFLPKGE